MMRFQGRSLLAFFLLVSASLAKEESVAEHVQTSRHKGRSHKVTNSGSQQSLAQEEADHKSVTSNRVKRESTKLRVLALSKFDVIDDDDGQMLERKEMLEDYDDVNSFQATSGMQTHVFFNAMDRYEATKGTATKSPTVSAPSDSIDEEEFGGFETKMSPDYDDTFDGIATKKIQFMRIFYKFDVLGGQADHEIANTGVGATDEWPGSDEAFAMADRNNNGKVDLEEFLEQKPCPGRPSKAVCKWMLWEAMDGWSADWTAGSGDWDASKIDGSVSKDEFTAMMGSSAAGGLWSEIDDGDDDMIQVELFTWFESRTTAGRGIDAGEWAAAVELNLIPAALGITNIDSDGCDNDGNGVVGAEELAKCEIDREEFLTMASHAAMELKKEFDECDEAPKDQQLTFVELSDCSLPPMDQPLFDLLDGDDDNDLDYWEFMTSYSELAMTPNPYFIALWDFKPGATNPFWGTDAVFGAPGNELLRTKIQFDNPSDDSTETQMAQVMAFEAKRG